LRENDTSSVSPPHPRLRAKGPYRSAVLRRKKREEEDEAGTALVPLGSRVERGGVGAPDASTQGEAVRAEVEDALAAQAAELGGKRGAVRRAQDMADIFFVPLFSKQTFSAPSARIRRRSAKQESRSWQSRSTDGF